MTTAEIDELFTYHAPKPGQPERYHAIREAAKVFAKILITETASDLIITVIARNHQKLLEELRRLRQRIKGPGGQTRWNQKVACTFGCALGQIRRFDLDKALFVQILMN